MKAIGQYQNSTMAR